MKLQLNAGDWATIALFTLGVLLGCYERAKLERPTRTPASATAASQSSSTRTAVAAVRLE